MSTKDLVDHSSKSMAQQLFEEGKRLHHENQPVKGTRLIAEAAKMGLAEAELEYAECLYVGRGVDEDQTEALFWFRQAASRKNATTTRAQSRLGCVLADPTTIDHNVTEAITYLEMAARDGDVNALFLLGQMHLEGRGGLEIDVAKAADLLSQAAFSKEKFTHVAAALLLVGAFDRAGKMKESLRLLETLAYAGNSYAQLQLGWRLLLGKGAVAPDAVKARNWLTQAAKPKVRPVDNDPAVLIAKALLANDYEALPIDKQSTLVRAGIDFEGPITIETNQTGMRIVECNMINPGTETSRVVLICPDVKADEIERVVSDCIALPNGEDPSMQKLGVALYVDLLDAKTGLRDNIPFAFITRPLRNFIVAPPETKEPSAESQHIVITASGHHGNNWLAVIGDMDKIMPTVLKYVNRDWRKDIAERNSGLEWLPQRLHLSLGKPAFGDIYVGKQGVGCSCWLYTILSTPAPTLRPEIHTAFPVIVAKARKYYLRVKQILEWHNRIEATMISEIVYTTDEECKAAVSKPIVSSQPVKEPVKQEPMSLDEEKDKKPLPQPSTTFPLFAIDYVKNRNIWEGRGILEVFASGIAFYVVRNPQESLHIQPRRTQFEGWSKDAPSVPIGLEFPDDDEDEDEKEHKRHNYPHSIVPDIAGDKGKTFLWRDYKDVRGIIVNEGPRKENRICYLQGICMRTIQLEGTIWGKSAYMITIRIDEEKKIDMDVWCLLKHMLDGRATITPGEYMTVNAGSVPVPGDLVFADVWIHGTIATQLDPVPTSGTLVHARSAVKSE